MNIFFKILEKIFKRLKEILKRQKFKNQNLRPTTSKVLGALFSMIGHANLEGKNFLDLYTGTGAIGIRSLDLGAKNCFFVDINHEFLTIIKNKLKKMNFEGESMLIRANCETQLNKIDKVFDFIFIDPPYDQKPFDKILEQLINYKLVHEKTKIFLEHSSRIKLSDEYKIFKKKQEKKYGDTMISVYAS
ncbi:MAG: hypothetical protein CL706_01805 [Chloroflexi bacterium]|nr:hypothetical protein [Chloroflexota bacterium]